MTKYNYYDQDYHLLIEGIDINNINKTVSFNPNHENNITTSEILNPSISYLNVDGKDIEVISIFKRKRNNYGSDGNPLIYDIKNKYGWTFNNRDYDVFYLMKQFIKICSKLDKKYDTIITVPSSNPLNIKFMHKLNNIINCDYKIGNFFEKFNSAEVFENNIKWDDVEKTEYHKVYKILEDSFVKMHDENDCKFSYKYIPPKYRKYISKTLHFYEDPDVMLYDFEINGKDIIVLDDVISTGSSLSETVQNILSIYIPKSITVITLFSKL